MNTPKPQPQPTYTPQQIATLENSYKLLQTLNGNPKARQHLEASMKEVNPALETEADVAARIAAPHIERIKAAEDAVADMRKLIADRDAAALTATEDARVNTALGWLDGQNYTAEGKDKIKKIMLDEKIPNVEAAAALFDKRNPPPAVIPGGNYQADSWDLRGDGSDKNIEEMFNNTDQWADREAALTLNAIRKEAATAAAA